MEILQKIEENPIKQQSVETQTSTLDSSLSLKNMEIISYLDLKDDMFNKNVMDKVDFISKMINEKKDLEHIDLKLGNDPTMSRIDKIYMFLKFEKMKNEKYEELNLISQRQNEL